MRTSRPRSQPTPIGLTGTYGYLNAMRLREEGPAAEAPASLETALPAIDGVEEIAFAIRNLYTDGHYYAMFLPQEDLGGQKCHRQVYSAPSLGFSHKCHGSR